MVLMVICVYGGEGWGGGGEIDEGVLNDFHQAESRCIDAVISLTTSSQHRFHFKKIVREFKFALQKTFCITYDYFTSKEGKLLCTYALLLTHQGVEAYSREKDYQEEEIKFRERRAKYAEKAKGFWGRGGEEDQSQVSELQYL